MKPALCRSEWSVYERMLVLSYPVWDGLCIKQSSQQASRWQRHALVWDIFDFDVKVMFYAVLHIQFPER